MYASKSENIIQLFPLSIYKAKVGLSENIENLITPIDKWMKF